MEGFELPFCLPNTSQGCGYGKCNLEGNWCDCFPGYEHDFTQLMFANCFLATSVKIGLFITLGIFSIFNMILAFYFFRKARSMPRLLIWVIILTGAAEGLQVLSIGLEGKPGIAAMIFLGIMNFAGAACSPALVIIIIIAPVTEMLRMHAYRQKVEPGLKIIIFFVVILQIATYIPALFYQYNGDFRVLFSVLLSCEHLVISIYAIGIAVAVRHILLKEIDNVILNRKAQIMDYNIKYANADDDPLDSSREEQHSSANTFQVVPTVD